MMYDDSFLTTLIQCTSSGNKQQKSSRTTDDNLVQNLVCHQIGRISNLDYLACPMDQ